MKKPESICIFGDSTSWGAWDLERGGWAGRLWHFVAKRDEDYVEVYNLGIAGGTTKTILKRFENEADARKADALIFQTGGNDASRNGGAEDCVVPIEQFRANLEEIIARAKLITDRILFVDLKNCDESRTLPVSWGEYYYRNADMEQYNQVMEEVCREQGVLFLGLDPLENSDFDDGLHPNADGHEKIYVQIKDFLEKNGWI